MATDPDPTTSWLKVAEVAEVARCGPRLVYTAIHQGKLRAARIGQSNLLRIHRNWIDEWLIAAAEEPSK